MKDITKKKHKIKIVIISNIPAPYRVAFFEYIAKHLQQYEITILYSARQQQNREWSIEGEKLQNSVFLKSKTIRIKRRYDDKYIQIPYNLTTELNKIVPDIVVVSEYNPVSIRAMHWCKTHHKKYISWTDGTLYAERNINFLQRLSRKFIIQKADAYLASSSKSREAQIAYGANEKKCFISSLTVDIDQYLIEGKNREGKRLLLVGSLIQRKGIDLLLKALVHVEQAYELHIVGEGPEREALKMQIEALQLGNKVIFHGFQQGDALRDIYAESDIFILPTREDCFGLVILEAMCAGLPVISSKYADGAYDLVVEGETGHIIDPNQAEQFAAVISQLLGDKQRMKTMGIAGKKHAEAFHFEKVIQGFAEAVDYVNQNDIIK